MALPSDSLLSLRGSKFHSAALDVAVRGGLLSALANAGLLPANTLAQSAPPTDTSALWLDTASNPFVLRKHNGTAWVEIMFSDVYSLDRPATNEVRVLSSEIWTVPDGCTSALIEAVGGGAGASGGRGGVTTTFSSKIGGGAGGSGGFASDIVALTPGDDISITIGAGGIGSNYRDSADSAGGDGGTTQFGSLLGATGGKGALNQMGGEGGEGLASTYTHRTLGAGRSAIYLGSANEIWHGGGSSFHAENVATPTGGRSGADGTLPGYGGQGAAVRTETVEADGIKGGDGVDGEVRIVWVA